MKNSAELQPCMRQIFSLLFQRLSNSKTTKFVRCFIVLVSFYASKVGVQPLMEMIDSIQPKYVFLPDKLTDVRFFDKCQIFRQVSEY